MSQAQDRNVEVTALDWPAADGGTEGDRRQVTIPGASLAALSPDFKKSDGVIGNPNGKHPAMLVVPAAATGQPSTPTLFSTPSEQRQARRGT